jgi:hypothetical protein
MMRVQPLKWWLLALVLATGCNLNPQPEPPFQEPDFDGVAGGSAGSDMGGQAGAGAAGVASPDDAMGGAGAGGSEQSPTLNPASPPNGMEAGGVRNHPDGGVADAGYIPVDPQH